MKPSKYEGYTYYALPFERNHDFINVHLWLITNWTVSMYICATYLTIVYVLERYMRHKPPVNVRKPFLWWNVALSIFSAGGMVRCVSETSYVLWNYGYEFSVCDSTINNVTGFWATAFLVSKVVELFETIFLILRKRLSFIHLIHHVLALLFTWYFVISKPGLGRWVGSMNYTVHAFMYAYFALKGWNIKIPEWVPFCVTSLQILQFAMGFVLSSYSFYVIRLGHKCTTTFEVAVGGLFINIFFFFLFGRYYLRRYFKFVPKPKIG